MSAKQSNRPDRSISDAPTSKQDIVLGMLRQAKGTKIAAIMEKMHHFGEACRKEREMYLFAMRAGRG